MEFKNGPRFCFRCRLNNKDNYEVNGASIRYDSRTIYLCENHINKYAFAFEEFQKLFFDPEKVKINYRDWPWNVIFEENENRNKD